MSYHRIVRSFELNREICKHFNLPVNSGKDDDMQDVIEHYREGKIETEVDAYEEGFESGKNLVLKKEISYKLIRTLSESKKEQEKPSTLNYINEWYEGIDNSELNDIFDNYRIESHESGDSDLYYKGLFDGIIEVWDDIKHHIN